MNQNFIQVKFYDSKISSQHFKLKILLKFNPQDPECKTSEVKLLNKICS
ncbi:hypothetical protein CAMGR0001_0474 [Campylobacter gracilis RM3268]|uniref:Uncharacterized protein n=1 Tax=Campylobacter gracilis RM3268 TaxID=553220 RepID=C8PHM8_9BACT|nr:hypothetical protein CAMGR0001_0474 [Campylobacter gracilis RM3268]